jgi:hypothetical protein
VGRLNFSISYVLGWFPPYRASAFQQVASVTVNTRWFLLRYLMINKDNFADTANRVLLFFRAALQEDAHAFRYFGVSEDFSFDFSVPRSIIRYPVKQCSITGTHKTSPPWNCNMHPHLICKRAIAALPQYLVAYACLRRRISSQFTTAAPAPAQRQEV